MSVTLLILVSSLGLVHGDESKVAGAKAEMKSLEGTWVWTHLSRGGIKVSLPTETVIVFGKDGSVVQKEPGQPEKKNTYRMGPSKTPQEMDIIDADGNIGILAIYELDGDRLRFAACDGENRKKKRLKKFDADDAYIWYLKRQKK